MSASPDDPLHEEAAPRSMPGSSILANVAWSTFHLAFSKVIRFIAIAYCVRTLGSYSWGQVAATLISVSFLYFAVDQGLGTVPTLHRVGDRGIDVAFLRRIGVYRLAMAVILNLALRLWDGFANPVDPLILIYSLALLPRALSLDWWFQRREIYHVTTGLANFRIAAFAVAAIAFIRPGANPAIVLWLELIIEIMGCLVAYLIYRRFSARDAISAGRPASAGPGYLELARLGWPFLAIGLLTALHQSVDILFLKYMCGFDAVGDYDVGYRIGYFLFFTGAGVIQVIRPKLARLHAEGRTGDLSSILGACSKILGAMGCLFLILSLYFNEPVIGAIFGNTGPLTRFVFQWAPVWVATAFMTMLCADTLLCMGEKRKYLHAAILCAATNVAANYFLIRAFGPKGSIFATLIAEFVFLAYAFIRLPSAIRLPLTRDLAPQALAMGTVVGLYLASRLAGHAGWFIAASLCAFAALVAWQGAWKPGTFKILARN